MFGNRSISGAWITFGTRFKCTVLESILNRVCDLAVIVSASSCGELIYPVIRMDSY